MQPPQEELHLGDSGSFIRLDTARYSRRIRAAPLSCPARYAGVIRVDTARSVVPFSLIESAARFLERFCGDRLFAVDWSTEFLLSKESDCNGDQ